ncbi:MAG: penicillin-binding protein 2 [Bacilli bacterium]|nr:penicillin-binding protein 2 [Bacilli bacterium]
MSLFKHKYVNNISKSKISKKKTKLKTLNKKIKPSKYLEDIIEKRYLFISIFLVIFFIIIGIKLFNLQILSYDKYSLSLTSATEKKIEGSSSPRGRIYDRNYNLLVDNKAIKTIYYKKQNKITTKEEIELAYTIGEILDIDYSKLSEYRLKNFWYKNNYDLARSRITDNEWDNYSKRKLNDQDIENLIFERITEDDLSIYTEKDKEVAYIYYLMNKGYSYAEKIIKNKNVTEEEYAKISENIDSLKGFNTKLDWERIYLYGDTFKSILGSVSSDTQGIPEELASIYLEKGYSLDDRVGISYLEYQYEDYLKGAKPVYKIGDNNEYILVSQGKRGNDIVLTIDIELQKYLEDMLSKEVINAKSEPNTKYYNRSFAILSNPKTGEILAMSGKQVIKKDNDKKEIIDYTPGITTLPVTPGSVVKGASMLVGYKYNAIKIGEVLHDECIKIKDTPEKCSWKTMGNIDDLYALRYSSNVYQYKIAIEVGKGKYQYNKGLKIEEEAFNKYRSMYASFGLGVKTEIDLPVESLGYSGKSKLPGHLLDFSIGQYDTYTPIQLSQYINTLANGGNRLKPYLLKEVYSPSVNNEDVFGDLIHATEPEVLGKVDVDKKYIDRVRLGFHQVVSNGLGYGYMGKYTNSAGKTGTSQSFIDTDGNGVVDTETITSSFVGYSPSDNPKISIVVVSPDIGLPNASYQSAVTKRISSKLVNKYFSIYK